MFKNKRLLFYLGLLIFLMFVCAGGAFGQEQYSNELFLSGEYWLANAETPIYGADQPALFEQEAVQDEALYLAEAKKTEEGEEKPLSPECAAFAKDPDADLGEVLGAGCQPTLAQMSALLDSIQWALAKQAL